MTKQLALVALLLAACGGDGNEVHTAALAGTWETNVSTVKLRAVFVGNEATGSAKLTQITPGDTATCEISLISDGSFTLAGASITITATSARQTTSAGCNGGESDTAVTDLTPQQNFASALSGPFVLTKTTLKLGNSYPTFMRVSQ